MAMDDRTAREQATKGPAKARAIIIPVTPLQQNCTLLWCETTRRAVVVDPGGDVANIRHAIAQADVTERWNYYEQLATVHRMVPLEPEAEPDEMPDDEDEEA